MTGADHFRRTRLNSSASIYRGSLTLESIRSGSLNDNEVKYRTVVRITVSISNPREKYMEFKLQAPFIPTGDQPEAIRQLVDGIQRGMRNQVLLGATGTGKTYTVASIIQQLQKPALIMAHNKTLAAQLYSEFREFFPENAVEYFVSYYDYYQPEAYVPRNDLFIEKETEINEEIERLRLAATTSLMSRRDVIIVASVSCIYGLGSPEEFSRGAVTLKVGEIYRRNALMRRLIEGQYQRNDMELRPGNFRVRGDTLELIPAYLDKRGFRIAFFGDEVERIMEFNPLTGEIYSEPDQVEIYPAKHYITQEDKLKEAIVDIETELNDRIAFFKANEKYLEAQRIDQRTRYDLEMLKEVGYCSGIENYSRHLDRREPGTHPWTLIDFLPSDYLLILDESHMTVPQCRGMYNGDRSRKETLVEYGFRLPSALDNRPLKFDEFEKVMGYTLYTTATPGPYEMQRADQVVEQIIRPTGLVDPEVEVRPTKGQVDDLVKEIRMRVENHERILVTTLTKRMAEDLSDYLMELGLKVHYLHSEVETLERVGILRDLRLGVFDVIVGINLLREGLDLPEVSLVAILDADKEGFLRSATSLIQTTGRAARHVNGRVIMYADRITDSMRTAIDETNRRRAKQEKFNQEHGITPVSISKAIRDITDSLSIEARDSARTLGESKAEYRAGKHADDFSRKELVHVVSELEKQMKEAAKNLEFEKAAALRDEMYELKSLLADDEKLKPWERIKLLTGEE
jgi:excinuclease ABC subunit B